MTVRARKQSSSPLHAFRPYEGKAAFPLSRDETIALVVALFCAFLCSAAIFGFATETFAEDAGEPIAEEESVGAADAAQDEPGLAEQGNDSMDPQGASQTASSESDESAGALFRASEPLQPFSGIQPVIIAAIIMGVALAVALVVSLHGKPEDKLGGPKGDVW